MHATLIRGLSGWDYAIIGFYFAFMIGIGLVFRRFSHDISDYFRGGGTMLWWMSGASALMGGISVWSFTGAAAKYHESGPCLYAQTLPGILIAGLVLILFASYRFRQMRVITGVDAIRRRYGRFNEQFYVWCQVPIGIFYGGLGLNTLSVFISSVFHTSLTGTIVVVGIIVIFVASSGGVWAVVAGDFVQMLIMLLVAAVTAALTLARPEIGGLGGLLRQMPAEHFHWTMLARPQVILFWIGAFALQAICLNLDLSGGAARYMTVKDGRHARKAATMGVVVLVLLPLVTMIPPIAAIILAPNLAAEFPGLKQPTEAAYVATAMRVLPQGVLGLLVSGMFAAAMASMDTGLNRNAGIFVKNFYSRVLRPDATARELLVAGKIVTAVSGIVIIGIGVLIAAFREINLFDFVVILGALLGLPLIVPLVWGIIIRGTPPWAAWSTATVGFIVAATVRYGIPPAWFAHLMGWTQPLSEREANDVVFSTMAVAVIAAGSAWFLFTTFFAAGAPAEYKAEVDRFFRDMRTPIDPIAEGIRYDDARQYSVVGKLCMTYGAVMLLGICIPNAASGRLCFAFIGGIVLGIGLVLYRAAVRQSAVTGAEGNQEHTPLQHAIVPAASCEQHEQI